MSIQYGIQSVIFYYLSCSPCAKVSHRHKAKKTAQKERALKQKIEDEQPGLYRHPSPFSTNPFWAEEIAMGPAPPKKKGATNSKNASSRALNTAGAQSIATSDGGASTETGSSPTMEAEDSRLSGDDWNKKRYQREDEELWGNEAHRAGQRIREAIATASESVGSTFRALEGRLSKSGASKEDEPTSYYHAKNPPLNELHPPIVSTRPKSKADTRWMLQPPPPARVMEGKERVNRSRSGSRGSSQKGPNEAPLSRQVTSRAVEEKLRRGENPSELELGNIGRTRTQQSAGTSKTKLDRGRKRSTSSGSSGSEVTNGKPVKASPLFSAAANRRMSTDSIEDTAPLQPSTSASSRTRRDPEMKEVVTRPALATIASSSVAVPQLHTISSTVSAPLESSRNISPPLEKVTLGPSDINVSPVLLPAIDSKFPGADTFKFPGGMDATQENRKIRRPMDEAASRETLSSSMG